VKITPMLWFNEGDAQKAAKFYCSVFPRSRITHDDGLTVGVSLDGNTLTLLNGGPHFQFTPAISFVVPCKNQKEIDAYWRKLTSGGGEPGQCGWCTDRFGVSWQVIPQNIGQLIAHPDAMQAMLKMKKLDVKKLQLAAAA
jgi:predicted 3-demethylubiquinone-9 3-methyltransferase (glyoxalase superfamily)